MFGYLEADQGAHALTALSRALTANNMNTPGKK